jgi:hypothetical protein
MLALVHPSPSIQGSEGASVNEAEANEAVDRLVDEYRVRCLWFMRPDYYPATQEERLRALSYIERHGDREAFIRAGKLRQWYSHRSSATSADS